MRLRVGLLLCLFAVIAMFGCRKPLAPNIDRNKAPETWITAAPFDTITLIKGEPPRLGTIPIRFHVYWAGSDQDGTVVGFYWAVVETLPLPPPGTGALPPLPGPRTRDYRYTSATDTTFIFTVAEDLPDRQHAFYIYAVDDKGKGDPTPARFVFNAQDRFPPLPVFDEAYGRGTVYFFDGGILKSEVRTFPIRDTLRFGAAPKDTLPSSSRVTFRFHGEPTLEGSIVKGFRYKLEEPELVPLDPDSLFHGNLVEYGVPPEEAGPSQHVAEVSTGSRVFQLRAVDQANGSRDAFRRFQMNFSPDTWFAGPDSNITGGPWQVNAETGETYAVFPGLRLPASGLPGSLLHRDSVDILPVNRPNRRTFLELYGDTVFIRTEYDTVHLGSWVIFHNGGFDTDSPYLVKVTDLARIQQGFPGGVVLQQSGQNGSPIGFRSIVTTFQTPQGPLSYTAESRLYPYYDPNDVLDYKRIGAYHPMTRAGRAYALQRAEDGDGARDGRIDDARRTVEFPNDSEVPLRPLVMVFEVDFPPVLKTWLPSFRPRPTQIDTVRGLTWNLELPADDKDPFAGGTAGGPSGVTLLKYKFKITGLDRNGAPLTYYYPARNSGLPGLDGPSINLPVPGELATGLAMLSIELCDCSFCDLDQGSGRCVTHDIQVYHIANPLPATTTTSRPGLN